MKRFALTVIACIAGATLLIGGANAAGLITSDDIKDGTIRQKDIRPGVVAAFLGTNGTRGANKVLLIEVFDNVGPMPSELLLDLEMARLSANCSDADRREQVETAPLVLILGKTSEEPVNYSIHLGSGTQTIQELPTGDTMVEIGLEDTFEIQLQSGEKTVLVSGTVMQKGNGTPSNAAACHVFATAILVE